MLLEKVAKSSTKRTRISITEAIKEIENFCKEYPIAVIHVKNGLPYNKSVIDYLKNLSDYSCDVIIEFKGFSEMWIEVC